MKRGLLLLTQQRQTNQLVRRPFFITDQCRSFIVHYNLYGGFPNRLSPHRLFSSVEFTKAERAEYADVDKWAEHFSWKDIPKSELQHQFTRSSGPGGQNVNKLSTKAEIRFHIQSARWMPEYVRKKLKTEGGAHVNKKGEFIITSDRLRTQQGNLDDCMRKLHQSVLQAATTPNETSQETKEKVKGLKTKFNAKRLKEKKMRSDKKKSRQKGGRNYDRD